MTGARILVVEDEFIIGEHLRRLLADLGHTDSDLVGSGEEALDRARDRSPDLVLLDLGLAGKMDGFETAVRIRSEYGIPIVFLTGSADPVALGRIAAMGLTCLSKPFDAESLEEALAGVGLGA